jgi:hypothetical protein
MFLHYFPNSLHDGGNGSDKKNPPEKSGGKFLQSVRGLN